MNQFKEFFYITLNYISTYSKKYLDDAAANIVQDLKNLEDFVPQFRYLVVSDNFQIFENSRFDTFPRSDALQTVESF